MSHYYSEKQESHFKPYIIQHDEYEFFSSSGVFSKDKVDKASLLLATKATLPLKGKVLDLGCGIGVIGILLKKRNKNLEITFSDVNERALKLTRMNLEKNNTEGIVKKSHLYNNIKDEYDLIISNPPIAAGRELCYKLIQDSKKHLKKEGSLQIVARHKKGGEMLSKKIKEVFNNCEEVGRSSGFRIYKGVKN